MSTTNLDRSSRGRTIVYWVTTLLLALECFVGGIIGALQRPPFIGIMKHLGYAGYVMTIIGVWYVLGGVALLVRRFPRLKDPWPDRSYRSSDCFLDLASVNSLPRP
jgi:DoxX-like family